MNRPRNRQPRAPRQGQRGDHNGSHSSSRGSPATPQQAAGTVPTIQQVVPGASVFIILKEDQPTGTETAGVVQELLTRSNHPRGIKVRLQDGQVGRVQRIGDGSAARTAAQPSGGPNVSSRFSHRYTDIRQDMDYPEEPPARSLADFLPQMGDEPVVAPAASNYVTVKCPFCESFEGDEGAVTHHLELEHLT